MKTPHLPSALQRGVPKNLEDAELAFLETGLGARRHEPNPARPTQMDTKRQRKLRNSHVRRANAWGGGSRSSPPRAIHKARPLKKDEGPPQGGWAGTKSQNPEARPLSLEPKGRGPG